MVEVTLERSETQKTGTVAMERSTVTDLPSAEYSACWRSQTSKGQIGKLKQWLRF